MTAKEKLQTAAKRVPHPRQRTNPCEMTYLSLNEYFYNPVRNINWVFPLDTKEFLEKRGPRKIQP